MRMDTSYAGLNDHPPPAGAPARPVLLRPRLAPYALRAPVAWSIVIREALRPSGTSAMLPAAVVPCPGEELAKVRRQFDRVVKLDYLETPSREQAQAALIDAESVLTAYVQRASEADQG